MTPPHAKLSSPFSSIASQGTSNDASTVPADTLNAINDEYAASA